MAVQRFPARTDRNDTKNQIIPHGRRPCPEPECCLWEIDDGNPLAPRMGPVLRTADPVQPIMMLCRLKHLPALSPEIARISGEIAAVLRENVVYRSSCSVFSSRSRRAGCGEFRRKAGRCLLRSTAPANVFGKPSSYFFGP